MNFERWLADLFGEAESEINLLLNDRSALHFLIVWSLFESKCFGGYMKIDHLNAFAAQLVKKESFDIKIVSGAAFHFHNRYQSAKRYKNLMHKQPSSRMIGLLNVPFDSLKPADIVFLASLVIYRFRNNIFHGNKGVNSWLKFKKQINLCTAAMQSFLSHAEAVEPSLK